jgi:homoaconitase/3-isopropylmalate dehydratase large subunit
MNRRRIPTKAELLRLQKLYRTDKRIAQILGNGVTEQLVAYWRRKKNLPRYSFPKFSKEEIQEAWDRFGDDFHAGMELGISKAAFYNWRRRYKITSKPRALKLEQLSFELFTADRRAPRRGGSTRQSVVQKIIARLAGKNRVDPQESVTLEPSLVVASDRVSNILKRFGSGEQTFVWNPQRIAIPLEITGRTGAERGIRRLIKEFVQRQQIPTYYDIGEGFSHQVLVENGHILPGQFNVGSDCHVTAYGCLGAIGTRLDVDAISSLWSNGILAVEVPDTIRINIDGRLPRGVFVSDLALHLRGGETAAKGAGKVFELYGGGVDQLSFSERFSLCFHAGAMGIYGIICPCDAVTRRYLHPRARRTYTPVLADRNAIYTHQSTVDGNRLVPLAASIGRAERALPVDQLAGTRVSFVFIGGAANGRLDDLKICTEILKGKTIHTDVRLFIMPASRAVYLEALKKGILRVLVESGAAILSSGCWPTALAETETSAGETTLTTTPWSATAEAAPGEMFLVSPATAAASALTGQVTNPSGYVRL